MVINDVEKNKWILNIFPIMQMHFASDLFYFYKDAFHYYFYYVNYKIVYLFNRNIYIIILWRCFQKC